ncbi:hypothetical protein TBLA_0H02300 [Henningerozyma blattae CBS 6284]|uniref:Uncharacterized protein n=1 Tax=Henningerozyma blattae (strain ATCC 34711 / CBS 6284 / DSM 70876 / NBRC 10599 / NRRL Y-10934 / UCD 77-7) TaxID=1071380 RepID=I2H813_HENB6|nr:hypothetical protein TBLA_0H02300 [Tetrapisispora blattae CBS 6284]CCH62515.1 hypothetical protein TBLA_0H02300 [Tetrapisispora blattae CBS 6284]
MSKYLLWPSELIQKDKAENAVRLAAIAITLQGTDDVILEVIEQSLLKSVYLEPPYSIVAYREAGSSYWDFVNKASSVIEFDIPSSKLLQFFSLEPISLILPEKVVNVRESKNWNLNFEYLTNHPSYQSNNRKLRKTLRLINSYYTYLEAFQEKYPSLSNNRNNTIRGSLRNFFDKWFLLNKLLRLVSFLIFYPMVAICLLSYWSSIILNGKKVGLVNISMTAQQIDLRCQQICYFPLQYLRFHQSKKTKKTFERYRSYSKASYDLRTILPSKYYPDYIRFYNTVWLVLNDISFGMIFGSLLQENNHTICIWLTKNIPYFCYTNLRNLTLILANNPLGIKLNEELARFFSELFLWIIEFWYNFYIKTFIQYDTLSKIISTISIMSSICGATFGLSIIIDIFSLLTLSIYLFYRISNKLYHWQFNVMVSLIYLFFGKKINGLRNRIDNHQFQLDELLLGTLLFITLLFLTPTILAFYLTFTILQMISMTFEIIIESEIALINHFPLFALLLRIKDPRRIPGGIIIESKIDTNINSNGIRYILKNKSINASNMLQPYFLLIDNLLKSYFSIEATTKILKGHPITINRYKLYQVLYSSLPSEPVHILDIYEDLKDRITNG